VRFAIAGVLSRKGRAWRGTEDTPVEHPKREPGSTGQGIRSQKEIIKN
jgi:hypothetical protein